MGPAPFVARWQWRWPGTAKRASAAGRATALPSTRGSRGAAGCGAVACLAVETRARLEPPMTSLDRPPLIGIPACLVAPDQFGFHQVGDKYVDSVVDGAGGAAGADPGPRRAAGARGAARPAGRPADHRQPVQRRAASLWRPGGAAPTARRSGARCHDPAADPRARSRAAVPLLAICRGLQELNVALGGTLHQDVHELPGRLDHRSDKTVAAEQRYGPLTR